MKTTLKGAFAKRKPGLSTAKGRSPKLSLDSKRGPVGYYKGNRVGPQGRRTPLGAFVKEAWRTPEIVVPAGLATTKLLPYVARSVKMAAVAPPSAKDFLSPDALKPIAEDADIVAALEQLRALKGDAIVAQALADHVEPRL